ncbi:thymidylate synthase [Streptomyces griseiscabiei]|uniref:thymidylate synthase n=1 Tax=Streptomyces griseiscabiei TaxID=2993540 RepID=A0ABU4KY15_9ACTN|nr:thymidylate synthase [Streptomyces griseiscabiei]MBZ3904537.1 thymidylate synthase [Streptomyces griseiscabiei]MDX2908286.1 thymidylate synthase [Streptomyces griseiscabiei]
MTQLTGDSVAELFAGAVTLAKSGEKVAPRSMATREVLDVHMLLTQPRARLLSAPPARILNPAFAVAETVWHLSGSDADWIFDYNARLRQYADDGVLRGAYGPRMRNWAGKVDQLRRVVEILTEDADSRRALIQLYDPALDAAGHKDVPCTLGFAFHLRAGRLHMTTTMRGQDVWIGLPYDLFFYTVLHELVAGWLGAELGDFHHHVGSLHIYEHHLDQAAHLTSLSASEIMPDLRTPWDGFDELLRHVQAGELTGHPGWDAMTETMHSYRLWKDNLRDPARQRAHRINGPLGPALASWYSELNRRAASARTVAGVR